VRLAQWRAARVVEDGADVERDVVEPGTPWVAAPAPRARQLARQIVVMTPAEKKTMRPPLPVPVSGEPGVAVEATVASRSRTKRRDVTSSRIVTRSDRAPIAE